MVDSVKDAVQYYELWPTATLSAAGFEQIKREDWHSMADNGDVRECWTRRLRGIDMHLLYLGDGDRSVSWKLMLAPHDHLCPDWFWLPRRGFFTLEEAIAAAAEFEALNPFALKHAGCE